MKTITTIALLLLLAAGCSQQSGVDSADDPVLVKVNGSKIYQSNLDTLLNRLTDEARSKVDADMQKKLLQSLVHARALAIAAEQQMQPTERRSLDARVSSYRDELLVQAYVENNIQPEPVSAQMVRNYYEKHKDDYTVPGKVTFQYLATTVKTIDDATRTKAIKALGEAGSKNNWDAYAGELRKQNIPVEYKAATLSPDMIIKPLRQHITRLNEGDISDLIIDERIFIAKVNKKEPGTVKPLHEVSLSIRKKLAPTQLKQALSQAVDKVLGTMTVEYIE